MRWTDIIIEKYRGVTNLVGTILLAWILSAFVSQLISLSLAKKETLLAMPAPSSSMDDSRSLFEEPGLASVESYMPICTRNIFDSQHRSPCAAAEVSPLEDTQVLDLDSPPIKSDLAVTLLGTMVSSIPEKSFAAITSKDAKEPQNYHIDDMILDEAKVYDIQRNRVFFIRNGHREFIEVDRLPTIYDERVSAIAPPPAGEGIKRIGDKVIVSRKKVDETLGNLNSILQDSRMVPNFEGGVVNGFKVFAIRPGSIFEELGLKNGDVVQRINGTDIDSVEKALPMMQLIKTEPSVAIDILRGGAKKSLSIEVR